LYKIPAITLFLGKNLIFVPECHSTNDLAWQLCHQSDIPEGSLVITDRQTAGKGQRGNVWEAEPGKNLTFSLMIKPKSLPIRHQFYLNIFVSLGVYDYLTVNGLLKVHIKWPNDILVNEKKVSGILIENQVSGTQITQSVLGIGLNVNQLSFSIETASSLALAKGLECDLNEVLENLLLHLETRYLQLKQNKYDLLLQDYLAALYWFQENHTFYTSTESFQGIITGIDEYGRLKVISNDSERYFDIKELKYGKG